MSVEFYNQNAQSFFESTVNVDVTPLYNKYLPYLKPKAHILDAGCGSGRDSKAFLDKGFRVTAIDASTELAKTASALINQPVQVCLFQEFESDSLFDGIWACASLLHVPGNELPSVFLNLANHLATNGVIYCSFKYGTDDVERDGRCFTNADESRLNHFITKTSLEIKEIWVTGDLRPGRENEKWLNVILVKHA